MNIPKVLGTTLVATFEFCFFIRKEFFKKKIRQIAFKLISLFNVQIIQEPINRSTTMKAFVFLAKYVESYYHKLFETRSRSCWMNVAPVASL